jgi:hypothetical protein
MHNLTRTSKRDRQCLGGLVMELFLNLWDKGKAQKGNKRGDRTFRFHSAMEDFVEEASEREHQRLIDAILRCEAQIGDKFFDADETASLDAAASAGETQSSSDGTPPPKKPHVEQDITNFISSMENKNTNR